MSSSIVEKRPETRPDIDPETNQESHIQREGIRLEIRWDIRPVITRDVSILFDGVEILLRQLIEAFFIAEGPLKGVSDVKGAIEALLVIEVEELRTGSLVTFWRLVKKTLGKGEKHLEEAAISLAFEKALERAVHLLVAILAAHGTWADPFDPGDPKAAGLPKWKVEETIQQGQQFLERLGRPEQPSSILFRETITTDTAIINLPLNPKSVE